MKNSDGVFHLAIPTHNLDQAKKFYVDLLGCRLARRYSDRITLDFFGNQVVCHHSPDKVDKEPQIYPRHFGFTLRQKHDYDDLIVKLRNAGADFFKDSFVRFSGEPEEHWTFFLRDPSNNLLEFKYYINEEMMF